jgi:hypothetical protein
VLLSFPQQTVIISLYNINLLIFITETNWVQCAARKVFLKIKCIYFRLVGNFPKQKSRSCFHVSCKIQACKILSHNYAGSKQKSYKIMPTKFFATLDKAKPGLGNISGLNSAAVQPAAFQDTKLLLLKKLAS